MNLPMPFPEKKRYALLILPEAAARSESIDLRLGEDVLLHIKPRPAQGVLAINTLRAGHWGRERHIAYPPDHAKPLALTLEAMEEASVRITLANEPPLVMALQAPFGAGRLCLSRDIRMQPSAGGTGLLHAQITLADMDHVTGLLHILPVPGQAPLLVVHGDGQLLGDVQTTPIEGDRVIVQAFSLHYFPHVVLHERSLIELFRRDQDGLVPLDRIVVQPTYSGVLEYASERNVTGWARNLDLPNHPVMLDVYLDGRHQGVIVANRAHSGPGLAEGQCGFDYELPEPVLVHKARLLQVSVRIRGTSIDLLHSPWAIGQALTLSPLQAGSGSAA